MVKEDCDVGFIPSPLKFEKLQKSAANCNTVSQTTPGNITRGRVSNIVESRVCDWVGRMRWAPDGKQSDGETGFVGGKVLKIHNSLCRMIFIQKFKVAYNNYWEKIMS